ncbi:MAG: hypothetical protein CVV10_05260 [Gammaproteobacteria bacterium HGW-Gammaproteobacteria-14]|nr:MAG: hypothetical protein CVV10_05260 [Gammaproteobacteria bacterium HGW-Gammaproteobacteria-14]
MSRMVRDSQVSGLRERLWFGQWMLRQLQAGTAKGSPRGELLALRGAVIFHLYSAVVGLARQALKGQPELLSAPKISLADIEMAATSAGVDSPELQLLSQARSDRNDVMFWLEQEALGLFAASGMARRPQAPAENSLAMAAEDPYAILAHGDLERLEQCCQRVQVLLQDATTLMEEW